MTGEGKFTWAESEKVFEGKFLDGQIEDGQGRLTWPQEEYVIELEEEE